MQHGPLADLDAASVNPVTVLAAYLSQHDKKRSTASMSRDHPTPTRTSTRDPERRAYLRKQAVVPAYLIRAGLKPRRCQVIDLSATGVQLEVGRYPITPGKRLEIVFVPRRGGISTVRRVEGIVVRRSKERIGVVFLRRLRSARPSRHPTT